MKTLELIQPDDWHIHLREGDLLARTVPDVARIFRRAIVMPNLKTPVATTGDAQRYYAEILKHRPKDSDFEPLMTIYLTDDTSPADLIAGFKSGVVRAAKLYPAHATTHSAFGVNDVRKLDRVFEAMASAGMPLLIHGEVTEPGVDVFDREKVFIDQVLAPLILRLPELRVVLEHITTKDAVEFVSSARPGVAATITPHHLMLNRNALFEGGLRPHAYCLPVLKREIHQLALRKAATSGNERFFLGTDSAPHSVGSKESSCGCAGIYSSPLGLEFYASVFEEEDLLERLEGFASIFGAKFYGLPLNSKRVRLTQVEQSVPESYAFGSSHVIPLRAGQIVPWKADLL